MAESSSSGLKTLQENEKLLVTSNFSFSYTVFKRFVLQARKNQGLFGKGLNSVLAFSKFDQNIPENFQASLVISLNFRKKIDFIYQFVQFPCLRYFT